MKKLLLFLNISFYKIGGEVDEGQPQEDTSDAAITPGEGESYSKYNAQKNKLILESTQSHTLTEVQGIV